MLKKLFFVGLLFLGLHAEQQLEGYYLTHINDKGKQAVVEIFKHDSKYYVYGFANTDGSTSIDDANPDPKLKGRTMKGVVFVWGLKQNGKEFDGGKIYNYATGKTYDASMWFNDKGELVVKASKWGFGKKFTWKRLDEKEVEPYLSGKPSLESVITTIPQ